MVPFRHFSIFIDQEFCKVPFDIGTFFALNLFFYVFVQWNCIVSIDIHLNLKKEKFQIGNSFCMNMINDSHFLAHFHWPKERRTTHLSKNGARCSIPFFEMAKHFIAITFWHLIHELVAREY